MKFNSLTVVDQNRAIRNTPQRRPNQKVIYGSDSETEDGYPVSFQFFGNGENTFISVNQFNASKMFLSHIEKLCARDRRIIIYAHNLHYDLVSYFYDRNEELYDEEFLFEAHGWRVEGVYAGLTFCFLSRGSYRVEIYDTWAFFKTSLKKLALIFCPNKPKLDMPENLGKKTNRIASEQKEYIEYAMRDAEIVFLVATKLCDMTDELSIKPSVSAPAMAAKIFTTHYVTDSILNPSKNICEAWLNSYHGGRNGLYVKPGYYKKVYSLDINSAYVWAMSTIPVYDDPMAWKFKVVKNLKVDAISPHAVYQISGVASNSKYQIIYDENFKTINGSFEKIWVTGIELQQAVSKKMLKEWKGHELKYTGKIKKVNAVNNFALSVWDLRHSSESKVKNMFWKLIGNSLYGKFVQTYRSTADEMADPDCESGGLFNPVIASLITAYVRVVINTLEIKYKAIHTATDSIFTFTKPKESPGLGGSKIDCHGDLLLVRNKLYIFYTNKNNADKSLKKSKYLNKYILKYALHGFRGTVGDLEDMVLGNKKEYNYTRPNTLRESINRGLVVNKFENHNATIKE